MRLLLGAHRAGLALAGIEQPGLLVDLAAVLENLDLPARLVLDGLLDEPVGVDVLDLAARAQVAEVAGRAELLIRARAADRDVHVGPQVALLHVSVAGAQVDQDRPQLLHVGGRLLRTAHVRPRDDLHQRGAGPVEIDEGEIGVLIVQALAGVLLQVQPLDPNREGRAVVALDDHLALADDRMGELADLVALRQVRIEVVLPVEAALQVDLRLQAQARADRLLHAAAVDHRQHPRHRRVHQADLLVRPRSEADGGAGEQLGVRGDLGVHLQAEDDFPRAGAALDQFGGLAHGPGSNASDGGRGSGNALA